jgi:hypothetical protein
MPFVIRALEGLPKGYNAWSYAPALDPSTEYDSVQQARAALCAAHIGPDRDGIEAKFEIVRAPS